MLIRRKEGERERDMAPLRKKGRGGGGGKVVAPVPEDFVPAPSPTAHLHNTTNKLSSGNRSRRTAGAEKYSPQQQQQAGAGEGAYASSNLATLVLRSFQREKGDPRSLSRTSLNLGKLRHDKGSDAGSSESTPRLTEFPTVSDPKHKSDKSIEVVQKTGDGKSLSRKKEAYCRDENALSRLSGRDTAEERGGRGGGGRRLGIGGEKAQETVRRSASVGRIREMKEKKFVCERSKATPSVRPREPKAASNHSNKEEGKRSTFHIASKEDDQSSSISVPSPCMQNNSPSSRHAALRNACALSLPLLQERLGWLGVDDSILRKSYRTYQFTDLRSSKNIIENRKGISVAPLEQHSDPSQVPASDGLSPFSRALQEKMAHLEGRVNQLAAELKQTKEQLSEKNSSSSRKAFIDIQSRIVRLEKLLAIKLAENGLLPSVGVMDCLTDTKDEAKAVALEAGNEDVGPSVSIQRDENHPTKSARFSASESPRKTAGIGLSSTHEATKVQLSQSRIEHDNLDGLCLDDKGQTELGSCHDNLEERLFPHVALMKNKPALHQKLMESRAALHQRLVDNRALLRRKLAALEGREAADDSTHPDGDVIAAEFLASLKQARDLGMQRQKMAKIKALISGAMPPQMSCLGQTSMEEPLDFNGTLEALPISLPQSNPSLQKAQGIITSGSAASYEKTVLSIDDLKEEPLSTYDGYILNQIIEDTLESTEGPRLTNTACRKTSETKFANRGSGGNLDCGGNMENNSIQSGCSNASVNLECEENISDDAANDQENVVPDIEHFQCISQEEYEDGMLPDSPGRLFQLGEKIATAGWFVSDGEGLLLAHEDSSCSFHDVANMEEKSRYCGPSDIAPSAWRDCWLIRAAGSDGRSNRYIVAASAGGALNSGFCCWDFYDKAITGYHWETQSCHTTPSDWYCSNDSISSTSDNISPSRQQLSSHLVPYDSETNGIRHRNEKPSTLRGKVPGSSRHSANTLSMDLDYPLWWYRPCGPLLASGGTGLKMVTFYDIRDGDMVMKWETQKSITSMEFSSPLQWRNKDKLVVAEEEAISLWDVNTTEARCLHNVNSAGKQLHALHILNSDAEVSGGVRQRIGSSETKGMDGVFCSEEAVNVLDFRVPIGIVMKIPIFGEHVDSVFTQGDAIFAAATSKLETTYSTTRIQCSVHQWSIRTGKPMVTYTLPESSAHYSHLSLAQVWGSDDAVMTANGNGLYIFDCFKGLTGQLAGRDPIKAFQAPKVVGSDDLYCPSFDYSGSRVLLISRDRPASCCYWP